MRHKLTQLISIILTAALLWQPFDFAQDGSKGGEPVEPGVVPLGPECRSQRGLGINFPVTATMENLWAHPVPFCSLRTRPFIERDEDGLNTLRLELIIIINEHLEGKYDSYRIKETYERFYRTSLEESVTKVLGAIYNTPRHEFVPENIKPFAYIDHALQIGSNQTISQPSLVAAMLVLLNPKEREKVLEIGSGSGWFSAILGRLVGENGRVYGLEIIPGLAEFGKRNIAKSGLKNIQIVCTDGSKGYRENAPYDIIAVSAATPDDSEIIDALAEQLGQGGRMIIPINKKKDVQEPIQILTFFVKTDKGIVRYELDYVSFVPLTGKAVKISVDNLLRDFIPTTREVQSGI